MLCSKIPTNCDKIRSSTPCLEGRIKKVTEKGEKITFLVWFLNPGYLKKLWESLKKTSFTQVNPRTKSGVISWLN